MKPLKQAADPDFDLLGARRLQKPLEAIRRELQANGRQEDAERVHRLRVAGRRAGCALGIFRPCLPKREFKRSSAAIRRVTRRLRDARDLDVQIVFLSNFIEHADRTKARPGLERLLLRLQQRRGKQQERVDKALAELQQDQVLEKLAQTLRKLRMQADLHGGRIVSASNRARARALIAVTLGELLSYEPYVEQEDRIPDLHHMRMAAKQLRYSMEVFSPVYEGALKPFIGETKKVQTLLGDLHDSDVWVDFLPRFEQEERARTLAYFGHGRAMPRLAVGLRYLAEDRRAERARIHREFVTWWKDSRGREVWHRLRRVIENDGAGESSVPGAVGAAGD